MSKRAIVIVLSLTALAVASTAYGSAWWLKPTSSYPASQATFSTGTESGPKDLQPDGGTIVGMGQSGIALANVRGLTVTVASLVDAGSMTAGTLQCWVYNPVAATWSRDPDLDLTVVAGSSQTFTRLQVVAGAGRIAWVPNGLGQPVNVYITAVP